MIDISIVVEFLEIRAVQQAFRLLVFIGFFVFVAGCLILIRRHPDKEHAVRRVFVIALVIGMIVPTLSGIMFPPFAGWYFFTDPAPENAVQYSVTVVDESGQEVGYPSGAAPPGRVHHRAGRIATNETMIPREQMAEFLLERAETHRRSVAESNSEMSRLLQNPPRRLAVNDGWTINHARSLNNFRELRIYRTELNTSSDGLRIIQRQRHLVYTYHTNDISEADS